MIKQIMAMFLFFMAYYVILSRAQQTAVKVFMLGLVAAVLKLSQGLTIENISRVVDFNTIGLLLGMMIIVSILKSTGFFPDGFRLCGTSRKRRFRKDSVFAHVFHSDALCPVGQRHYVVNIRTDIVLGQ